ncbi:MAG: CGNR zinc finger domain-containing protein [Actinomycetota bacterium]
MQVASATQSDARATLEAAITLLNGLTPVAVGSDVVRPVDDGEPFDVRQALDDVGFTRAAKASAASIDRIGRRVRELRPLFDGLLGATFDDASAAVNEQLTELAIRPAVVAHDGVGPHLHWSASTATFDDQVLTDILMALAIELCEDGTERFGRCAADGCGRLFFDSTRNRSRRFCDDRRCASRTHTADHRARRRSA